MIYGCIRQTDKHNGPYCQQRRKNGNNGNLWYGTSARKQRYKSPEHGLGEPSDPHMGSRPSPCGTEAHIGVVRILYIWGGDQQTPTKEKLKRHGKSKNPLIIPAAQGPQDIS